MPNSKSETQNQRHLEGEKRVWFEMNDKKRREKDQGEMSFATEHRLEQRRSFFLAHAARKYGVEFWW